MIMGLGVDIIEIERVKQVYSYHKDRFLRRILNDEEIASIGNPIKIPSLAARYAAKEAISKALGTGISGFSWRDIQVDTSESGEPLVELMGQASIIAKQKGIKKIHVTLSHSMVYAVAMAVAEG